MFDHRIDRIEKRVDLIVLPEMFTTGFSMNADKLAQEMGGPSVRWMRAKAGKKKCCIMGSMIIRESGRYYNRLIWAEPDGGVVTYDKRHLFRYAGEDKVYSPGKTNITVKVGGWCVRPFICYDLRFPVWTRNGDDRYDVAVFIANWPRKRAQHWKRLLQARAIENQCYVIGVNRVGEDGNGHSYSGDSMVIGPGGDIFFHSEDQPCSHTAILAHTPLESYRNVFPAWKDADRFSIHTI